MRKIPAIILLSTVAVTLVAIGMFGGCRLHTRQAEPNLGNIPDSSRLSLPAALEPMRNSLEATLASSELRLKAFAEKNGWRELTIEPFFDSTEIYADKGTFDRRLRELFGVDSTVEVPPTASAVLERRVLIAVSPSLYDSLYPEGRESNAYEKLLTHEMAHRLHIRILNGDEEAMGPIWFYEGFALYAAEQFVQSGLVLPDSLIWEISNDTERGSYIRYAAIFRHFVARHPLPELIARAGQSDFVAWLREGDSIKD